MPVEDVSVEWDENISPPVILATLHIPPQQVDSSGDLAARCESIEGIKLCEEGRGILR